jgi:hypothetical protein
MGGVIPQNVPFEGFAEQGHVNAGPAEVLFGKFRQQLRQKLQDQIFESRHQIVDDDKQSTLRIHLDAAGCFSTKLFHPFLIEFMVFYASSVRISLGRWKK